MAEYESVLLIKSEVFVYKIPPRTSNRGYRATEWNLDQQDWTGRLRLVAKGKSAYVKLEDKNGLLFAECPIDQYPGPAVESVNDSSRYFVLRIQDGITGRTAFIGIGFADRADSFDLNVALQDHFKWVQKEDNFEKEKTDPPKPSLDLGFKEGETIKINMKITKKDGGDSDGKKPKKSPVAGGLGGILPPPPGGVKIAPPPLDIANKRTPTGSPSHHPPAEAAAPANNNNNNNTNTSWVQF